MLCNTRKRNPGLSANRPSNNWAQDDKCLLVFRWLASKSDVDGIHGSVPPQVIWDMIQNLCYSIFFFLLV